MTCRCCICIFCRCSTCVLVLEHRSRFKKAATAEVPPSLDVRTVLWPYYADEIFSLATPAELRSEDPAPARSGQSSPTHGMAWLITESGSRDYGNESDSDHRSWSLLLRHTYTYAICIRRMCIIAPAGCIQSRMQLEMRCRYDTMPGVRE